MSRRIVILAGSVVLVTIWLIPWPGGGPSRDPIPASAPGDPLVARASTHQPPEPSVVTSLPKPPRPGQPALFPPSQDDPLVGPPHPDAVAFGSTVFPPKREPDLVLGFFELYRERFGAFPTGEDNAQFMNALRGTNPGRLAFFPSEHERLDPDGALLDAWGRPFFFHLHGQHRIEVRSAGPDGAMFTDDDLVAPRRPVLAE